MDESGEIGDKSIEIEFRRPVFQSFFQGCGDVIGLRLGAGSLIMKTIFDSVFRVLKHRCIKIVHGNVILFHHFRGNLIAAYHNRIELAG